MILAPRCVVLGPKPSGLKTTARRKRLLRYGLTGQSKTAYMRKRGLYARQRHGVSQKRRDPIITMSVLSTAAASRHVSRQPCRHAERIFCCENYRGIWRSSKKVGKRSCYTLVQSVYVNEHLRHRLPLPVTLLGRHLGFHPSSARRVHAVVCGSSALSPAPRHRGGLGIRARML